jgi:transcriptional regulator with XRE-family HTH domain
MARTVARDRDHLGAWPFRGRSEVSPICSPQIPQRSRRDSARIPQRKMDSMHRFDAGISLYTIRQERGWSRRELARKAKLDEGTLRGIESGSHAPSRPTIERLARALKMRVDDLGRALEAPGFEREPQAPREGVAPAAERGPGAHASPQEPLRGPGPTQDPPAPTEIAVDTFADHARLFELTHGRAPRVKTGAELHRLLERNAEVRARFAADPDGICW